MIRRPFGPLFYILCYRLFCSPTTLYYTLYYTPYYTLYSFSL